MVDVNFNALYHVTRAVLPGMVERGRGHVVNLGSIAGSYPYPGGNVYGATKAFVLQFSNNVKSLTFRFLSPRRVVALLPAEPVGMRIDPQAQRRTDQRPPAAKPFELTVDSIMRGPDLVGYTPTGVYWSQDSRRVFFRWKRAGEPRLKYIGLRFARTSFQTYPGCLSSASSISTSSCQLLKAGRSRISRNQRINCR